MRRLLSVLGINAAAGFPARPATTSAPASGSQPTPMPPIVYGTAWKKERTKALVLQALRAGFRGIDTACQPKHYNEAAVGEAIAEAGIERERLYIQTKYTPISGQDPQRVPYDAQAPVPVQVEQSVAASLRNLRVQWIDCLLLHSPLPTHSETMSAWRAMEAAHAAGHVRSLGLSNCYDSREFKRIYAEAAVKPTVLQNRFYRDSGYDVELRAFCRAHGVQYQVRRLAPGFLAWGGRAAASAAGALRPVQLSTRRHHSSCTHSRLTTVVLDADGQPARRRLATQQARRQGPQLHAPAGVARLRERARHRAAQWDDERTPHGGRPHSAGTLCGGSARPDGSRAGRVSVWRARRHLPRLVQYVIT